METQMYIFVLGRNAELSVAEIKAVFEKNNWEYKVVLESYEVLIVSSKTADTDLLHKTLGGTVKIGRVEKVSTIESLETDLNTDFLLEKILAKNSGKVQFGISVYSGGDRILTDDLSAQIIPFSKGIKALLEQKNFSVRFAFSRERTLSSVTVDKNKLIQKGAELLLIPTRDKVYIGKTLSVQEFEEFSKRDYGRPARDMKSGIMPPKLARIMINLAGINSSDTLLDPFCGSGTILQEAVLLGYSNIIGRDISEKAISDTRENLEWLKDANLYNSNPHISVEQDDVVTLSSIQDGSIQAVVAEPYLGPTLHGQAFPDKLRAVESELMGLYKKAFVRLHSVLASGGTIVIILPAFPQRQGIHFLEVFEYIKELGFEKEQLNGTPRGSILYGNKYDFVLREIVKFKKK